MLAPFKFKYVLNHPKHNMILCTLELGIGQKFSLDHSLESCDGCEGNQFLTIRVQVEISSIRNKRRVKENCIT